MSFTRQEVKRFTLKVIHAMERSPDNNISNRTHERINQGAAWKHTLLELSATAFRNRHDISDEELTELVSGNALAGGFADAWHEYRDQIQRSGRAFGPPGDNDPVLSEPLDKDVHGEDRRRWLERWFPNDFRSANSRGLPKSSWELHEEREKAEKEARRQEIEAENKRREDNNRADRERLKAELQADREAMRRELRAEMREEIRAEVAAELDV